VAAYPPITLATFFLSANKVFSVIILQSLKAVTFAISFYIAVVKTPISARSALELGPSLITLIVLAISVFAASSAVTSLVSLRRRLY